MSVRIEIDKQGSVFTCLDLITGRVVFNVEKNTTETVSSINVKLEGVSKTRLLGPKENDLHDNPRSSKKVHIEIHKLLYQVKTVFPPEQIRKSQEAAGGSGETDFTLPAGTHTYPFSFRIPINNSCRPLDSLFSKLTVKEGNLEYARDAEQHTKNTLPPSLHSQPGGSQGEGGSIRYYIKATVNRPQFYRMNVRKEAFFVFLPIDPPREVAQAEVFARREHLLHFPLLTPLPKKKKGFWGKSKEPEIQTALHPNEEPRFTIEARLPSPPVLVPKKPLSLRIIMAKLAPFKTPVVLRQVQLRLFMTTLITAHEHSKKVTFTVPLFNTYTDYRLGMPIPYTFGPTDALPGAQLEADPRIWENWVLPENISPSFRTCNIARSYQLEVTLGVSLGEGGIVDQIPLLIPIEVYTGFTPSAKLLAALNYRPTNLQLNNPRQLFLPRQDHTQQHLRVNSYPAPSSPLTSSSSSRPSSAAFPSTYTNQPSSPSTLQAPFQNSYCTNSYEAPPHQFAYTEPPTSSTTTLPIPSPASSTFPQSHSPSFPSHEGGSGIGGEIWQPVQPQHAVHMAMVDAPPTYEDAVLREVDDVDIMVADGPRREYPLQSGYFEGDGKRASRLFPS
ncbi:hypothetical protein BGX38DRAFT_1155113 [Terfezia claveryi]|nr:hypothetical protein BGX38DRAFT_1155113 [Terfezia claveryi]